jgi:hypothetical protein
MTTIDLKKKGWKTSRVAAGQMLQIPKRLGDDLNEHRKQFGVKP